MEDCVTNALDTFCISILDTPWLEWCRLIPATAWPNEILSLPSHLRYQVVFTIKSLNTTFCCFDPCLLSNFNRGDIIRNDRYFPTSGQHLTVLDSDVNMNLTMPQQDLGQAFTPVVDADRTGLPTSFSLQDRDDSTCIQTVKLPVWYGVDYNTCSMQTTTAPCSVSFPTTSCHTARPDPLLTEDNMSESKRLWIVVGLTIFFTVFIPVFILWVRWKLTAPRRDGKRSISVQLERNEVKKSSKRTSSTSSTREAASKPTSSQAPRSRKDPQGPNNHGSKAQDPGTQTQVIVILIFHSLQNRWHPDREQHQHHWRPIKSPREPEPAYQ